MILKILNAYMSTVMGENIMPIVDVNQYDHNGKQIQILVRDMDITGMYAVADGKKPDDTYVYNKTTISDSSVFVDITLQMTAVSGSYDMQVTLFNESDDSRAGIYKYTLRIAAATVPDPTVVSTDEYTALVTNAKEYDDAAAASAAAASASADSAAESASQAAQSATNAAESQNAAAISATDAASSATSASDSASAASTSASQAADSATTAAQSNTEAGQAATQVGQSATNAAESERLSGISATDAGLSATAAAGSATDAQSAQTATESARDAAVTAKTAAETARDRTITEAESIYTIQHAPPMASLYTAIILETPTLGVL